MPGMEAKKIDISELSDRVMLGISKASRILVETSAANGRSLIVYVNGEIKKVPAKELLSRLPQK